MLEADQCLYLDIDIAILDDLTPLMETELGDCYIGGVTDRLCLVRPDYEGIVHPIDKSAVKGDKIVTDQRREVK